MTMNTQHTPGPWIAQRDLRHSTNLGALTDNSAKAWGVYGRYRVACIEESLGSVPFDEDALAEANARLIAAAPDLLAALSDLMECLTAAVDAAASINPGDMRGNMRASRAAIAKATQP